MWFILDAVANLRSAHKYWLVASVGAAAFAGAALLMRRTASSSRQIASRNRFSGKGRVEVDGLSIASPSTEQLDVASRNRMKNGEVVVRDVRIGDEQEEA